ncbi:MAG: ATP-binding protein [Bacteroidota bacterium]
MLKAPLQIWTVVQDEYGFLWLGGVNGLARFDGQHFKRYIHNPKDSTSILSGPVKHLEYDRENNCLWVSYWKNGDGGFSRFDLATEKFTNYLFKNRAPSALSNANGYWSAKDRFGQIWQGLSQQGVAQFDPEQETFRHFPYLPDSNEMTIPLILHNRFEGYALDRFNDSLLWIASGGGLLKFNVQTHQFQRYAVTNQLEKNIEFRVVFQHTDGTILVGGWRGNFYVFDPTSEQFRKKQLQGLADKMGKFAYYFTNIAAKSSQRLWLTTDKGMMEYDLPSDRVIRYWANDTEAKKLYGIRYIDRQNRFYIWSGTQLTIYDPLRQQIRPYDRETDNPAFHIIFRRFLEDKQTGKLWLAAQISEGLYRLDLQTGEWEVFPPEPEYFQHQKSFQAWDILQTQSGEILLLEKDKIYRFSEKEQRIVPYEIQPNVPGAYFKRMIEDREGNLWIGSHYRGLIKIDLRTQEVQLFKDELIRHPDINSPGAIWDLQEDRNGNIWIRGNGYSVYDVRRDTFYSFPYLLPGVSKILHTESLGKDKDGNVWALVHDEYMGITDADHPEKGVIRLLSHGEEMKSYKPGKMQADDQGNIWITSQMLEKLKLEDMSSQLYEHMFFGQFIQSIAPLSDGRMILGFKRKIGIFYPDSLRIPQIPATPYVSSFKVFDEERQTEFPLYNTKDVYLKAEENFFSFLLSAVNPSYMYGVEYEYQLEGIDPGWVNPGNRRYVAYTDIQPGTHTFRVKASTKNGIECVKPYELRIHIEAPWYQTIWAYLGYMLVSLGIMFLIYRVRTRRRLLQQTLKEEQAEAERLKELDEVKNKLFTNITHEFRTPLTVILGLTDEIERNPSRSLRKRLGIIRSNGQSLLQLVNQLLDLARVDAGSLTLKLIQDDVIGFLRILVDSLHSHALSRNIGLQFYSEEEVLQMDFDPTQLQRIITNLLSNAFKFTPEYGKILVVAQLISEEEGSWLKIKVKDTGIGISSDKLPHIFDRFYQIDDSSTRQNEGSGIGLALVKELVNLMKGNIEVESKVGKGSTFSIGLPIRNQAEFLEATPAPAVTSAMPMPQTSLQVSDSGEEKPIALVIEDNMDVIYYLQSCLEVEWRVVSSLNGPDGIEKALEVVPDVIISDVMMPGMSGFEVVETLKSNQLTSHIPILMLTAKSGQMDKLTGLEKGADAYLIKPFDKEELQLRLGNFLNLRRRLQEHLDIATPEENPPTAEQLFLETLHKIIHQHLDDPDFTSNQLAHQAGISRSQLHRKLKALTNKSTTLFIRSYRLKQARHLLLSTDLQISEVAWKTGFSSLSWFDQVYRMEFQQNPSETRK